MTWLRDDALTYDLRGKLVSAIGSQGTMDQFTAIYSGLGYLMETTLDSDGQATTGHGQHFFTREQFAYDGMGRLHFAKDSTDVFQTTGPGGSRSSSTNIRQNTYFQTVADLGRLNLIDAAHQSYSHEYDEGGSLVFVESAPDFPLDNTPAGSWDDRASYYDALGQLVASDKGFMADAAVTPDGWFRRIFEEYRYDALGRRVLVRMRQFCANNGPAGGLDAQCNYHSVRRTVWDRDQELWEIQMPDDPAHRETDVAVGAAEIPDMVDQTATPIDLNMLWGRVAYTHAGAVDRPLAVHRLEYADHPDQQSLIRWPLFTNLPLYDYKGEVTTSAYANGAKNHCNPVGSTRCVFQAWPAGYFAYWRQGLETLFWHGTLVRDKRDMTGTHYRRNRYYDPNSGQFTQEDPIGLAGGLNLYGFAGGDPVNFSDPFGLMPCDEPGDPRCEHGSILIVAVNASAGLAKRVRGLDGKDGLKPRRGGGNIEIGVAVNLDNGASVLFARGGLSAGVGGSGGLEITGSSGIRVGPYSGRHSETGLRGGNWRACGSRGLCT